jgi:hypothetical protein
VRRSGSCISAGERARKIQVVAECELLFDDLIFNPSLDLGTGKGTDPISARAVAAGGKSRKPIRSGDDRDRDKGTEESRSGRSSS